MISSDKNINISAKRVLVAPLDWGLGHATRCVPVIQQLIHAGFEVLIAAEKKAAILLRQEFPSLTIIPLPGYRISYAKSRLFFSLKILSQVPKILKAIKAEHKWLQQIIKDYRIDIVISDNRYGLYNKAVTSIFITHQLRIETGNAFTNSVVQKINYRLIKKFSACWVSDKKGEKNLAGKLSHPKPMPDIDLKYIGVLSRCRKEENKKNIELLIVLSGPEPQRTTLENILLAQMKECSFKIVLVRGLPGAMQQLLSQNKLIEIYNHLPAEKLNSLIQSAKIVIARSGYSTIMDLAVLQQPAILIATPGQTEQEYLAKYLADKKYCQAAQQQGFNLAKQLNLFKKNEPLGFPLLENNELKEAINSLL
ncbi:MAG: glycosyltransferase family protein [Ferruginibacter sp.]